MGDEVGIKTERGQGGMGEDDECEGWSESAGLSVSGAAKLRDLAYSSSRLTYASSASLLAS